MAPYRWFAVGSVACTVTVAFYFAIPQNASDANMDQGVEVHPSQIVVEPGKNEPVTSRVVTFSILNRDSKRVTIESLQSSCGCTVAGPLAITELLPGQSVTVPLTVEVPSGPDKKARVSIQTSSQRSPHLTVELRIIGRPQSLPSIESIPPEIHVAGATAGDWVEHLLEFTTVEAKSNTPWLEGILDSPGIQIRDWICETDAGPTTESTRRTYRGRVLVRIPDSVNRRELKRIEFTGSPDESAPRPSLVVSAILRPLIRSVPPELAIHFDEGLTPIRRKILLVSSRPWSLPDQLPNSDAIHLNSETIDVDAAIKSVIIEIDPRWLAATEKVVQFTIPTSLAEQPIVSIPITIVRRKADPAPSRSTP
jgi:hypothetical protein